MIVRIWHGYTSVENAKAYEQLLKEEIFVGIQDKNIAGYKGIQLSKRKVDSIIEFTTMMWFDDIASVSQFAGKDYTKAYVPQKARELLLRFDAEAIHCEVLYGGI